MNHDFFQNFLLSKRCAIMFGGLVWGFKWPFMYLESARKILRGVVRLNVRLSLGGLKRFFSRNFGNFIKFSGGEHAQRFERTEIVSITINGTHTVRFLLYYIMYTKCAFLMPFFFNKVPF